MAALRAGQVDPAGRGRRGGAGRVRLLPSVTREPYRNNGRLTDLILSNKMTDDLGLPPLNPETDRAMICGSPSMNKDTAALLDARGFVVSPGVGEPGDYVIERAFVER